MKTRLSLSEALARLPGRVAAETVERLTESSLHEVYRLRLAGRDVVLRIADRGGDLDRVLAAQRLAASNGLAPEVLLAAPDAGLLVSEFVAGSTLTSATLTDSVNLDSVAKLLHRLHALPCLGQQLDLVAAARTYEAASPSSTRVRAAELAEELRRRVTECVRERLVPCHNDPVASNFVAGDGLRLLDWEYAADNDPLFDLAVVSAHHDLDSAARQRLATSYDAERAASVLRRLPAWERLYRCLFELWKVARAPKAG